MQQLEIRELNPQNINGKDYVEIIDGEYVVKYDWQMISVTGYAVIPTKVYVDNQVIEVKEKRKQKSKQKE